MSNRKPYATGSLSSLKRKSALYAGIILALMSATTWAETPNSTLNLAQAISKAEQYQQTQGL